DTFSYTITDSQGATATATVTITVTGVNDVPVAVDDTGATNEDSVLNAAAPGVLTNDSDVDATDTFSVTSYDAASTAGASVTVNADGSYSYDPTGSATLQALALGATTIDTFTYTITDSQLATATATVSVTVSGVNDAPVAAFSGSPISGSEPLTVAFADGSTDIDNSIVGWSWDFGDTATGTDQNPSHIYVQEGTYTVTLTVTDNDGGTDTLTKTNYITVSDTDPTAVIAYTLLSTAVEPVTIQFGDDSVSYDGIVTRSWDFGDGTTSTDSNPTHTYPSDGSYTVTLTVAEADGDTHSTTVPITVNDSAPTAGFNATPSSGPAPLTVTFTDISAAYDGIASLVWDFGDASANSSVQNPTHTYAQGTYTVTLTVTDNDGTTDSATATITATAFAGDTDSDGDGWYVSQGDCKDDPAEVILDNSGTPVAASAINPGATEICDDGIDQDCFDGDRDCAGIVGGVDLADSPLDVSLQSAAPNIMFVIDDSGSMDWEFMTPDGDDGLMWVGGDDYYYLYDSNDNINQTSIWPVLGGGNNNTEDRKIWKSQWSGYNVMYYSPTYQYDPWVGEPDADTNTPKAHPMQTGATPNLDLNASYFSLSGVDVINAHYYVWSDSQGKPYLVVLDGAIKYYEVTTGGDYAAGLVEKTGSDIPADVESVLTYAEERQNFANWYSFYRKRWLASVTAMTSVLTDLRGVMVGWRT
ncbi:MAG: PKD domain-containing protein, partial [Gammaproteobacteria bacterium]